MSPSQVTHVVVGFNKALLAELDGLLTSGSVLVVEEPDIIEARDVHRQLQGRRCVAGLVAAPVQDEHAPDELLAAVDRPVRAEAVVPANEYSVVAAAVLAEAWGLSGATPDAARTLRDKIRLRERCAAADIPQPRFREVFSSGELARFRSEFDGRCVIKPANRQGSLGVQLLGPDNDIARAWQDCVSEEAPLRRPRRPLPTRYLAEELLSGDEISVESLVHGGEVVFTNITAKRVRPGRRPVESGHVVPAGLPEEITSELADLTGRLVAATGFDDGILHAEWMLVDGVRPHLIECAGRLPGDSIGELIDLAYGGSLTADFIAILHGRRPIRATTAHAAAAIRFLTAEPGTVLSVDNVDEVRRTAAVHEVEIAVSEGDEVHAVAHSWDRLGWVVTAAGTAVAAEESVRVAADTLKIRTG